MEKDLVNELIQSTGFDLGRSAQMAAVRVGLHRLLSKECRGIVLADEVGFGKTYEALGIAALLSEHYRRCGQPFDRILVLCKSSLVRKWQDEVTLTSKGQGFRQYLNLPGLKKCPIGQLLDKSLHIVNSHYVAERLRVTGRRKDGCLQVPPGFYIVNEAVLAEDRRNQHLLLKRLFKTRWDLIIVDEAHHYAKGNKPARLFDPQSDFRDFSGGLGDGEFRYILTLTATPFELDTGQLVRLLLLARANPSDVDRIERGLALYQQHLNRLFELRRRSQGDELRGQCVEKLRRLRTGNALDDDSDCAGLEELLRKYVIRNTKQTIERNYWLVNKQKSEYETKPFDKLGDMRWTLHQEPLIPFEGADTLYYFKLREMIQETFDSAQESESNREGEGPGAGTFVSTDLQQGLSSYPQLLGSALLARPGRRATELRELLKGWTGAGTPRLHPKVAALCQIVKIITLAEIDEVRKNHARWFGKIVVFNKLITGTAKQLNSHLQATVTPLFREFLNEMAASFGVRDDREWRQEIRAEAFRQLRDLRKLLNSEFGRPSLTPGDFPNQIFEHYRNKPLVDCFEPRLAARVQQPLFLLRCLLHGRATTADSIRTWLRTEIFEYLGRELQTVIDMNLDDTPEEGFSKEDLFARAENQVIRLLEEVASVDVVGRYDGDDIDGREARRRNFNDFYNPYILIVSRVGEEGIDLQRQCRYVLHYDLEWNPAKMEQREGRVDRDGFNAQLYGSIDVRFFLLKHTYEERVFHTVMQRDAWFQILIGSKRRELGTVGSLEVEAGNPDDREAESTTIETNSGTLTSSERTAIMLDLRPR